MTTLKNIFKGHTLFLTYLVVFFGLLYEVHHTSGATYFGSLMIYFAALMGFYFLFGGKLGKKYIFEKVSFRRFSNIKISIHFILIPTILVIIGHTIELKGIPALQALK